MVETEIKSLVEQFADAVEAQNEAMSRGDADSGNQAAKQYAAAFAELRRRGDAGREALASLFVDNRKAVRIMAAAYLLRFAGDRARAVLEREAQGPGLLSFGAAQALKRWNEGTWSLDPP